MCYSVYVGSSEKLKTGKFIPEKTEIYLEQPTEDDLNALRLKFKNPYIYYVGSSTQCSCGLQFDPEKFNDPKEQINKTSPMKFLEFINEQTKKEDLEFYCCWDGKWNEPVESRKEIDIRTISLGINYFGLVEKQYIKFKKQE